MWSPILRGMCQLELLYMQADCISCDRASMSQKKRRIWGTYIILILNYNQNKIKLGCSIFKCTSNLLRLCVYYYPIFFPLKSLFSFSGQLLSERPLGWRASRLTELGTVWYFYRGAYGANKVAWNISRSIYTRICLLWRRAERTETQEKLAVSSGFIYMYHRARWKTNWWF